MNFNFCLNCGKQLSKHDDTEYQCGSCGSYLWNNPKATVVVLFMQSGQLLFSKRAEQPHQGKYDFPGGFVQYGESVWEAAVREIFEETTVHISPEDLTILDIYSGEHSPGVWIADVLFVVRNWNGTFTPQDDSASLEWHEVDFMKSDKFVPHYQALYPKIKAAIQTSV